MEEIYWCLAGDSCLKQCLHRLQYFQSEYTSNAKFSQTCFGTETTHIKLILLMSLSVEKHSFRLFPQLALRKKGVYVLQMRPPSSAPALNMRVSEGVVVVMRVQQCCPASISSWHELITIQICRAHYNWSCLTPLTNLLQMHKQVGICLVSQGTNVARHNAMTSPIFARVPRLIRRLFLKEKAGKTTSC